MPRFMLPLCLLSLVFAGCAATGRETLAEHWQCTNDLEVSCGEGTCRAASGDGFTPMSVSVDGSGDMSVCAYSGCWEGAGEMLRSEQFVVWIGHDLGFSTSPARQSAAEDAVLAIDRTDSVATLKVGEFAQPLICDRAGALEPAATPTSRRR